MRKHVTLFLVLLFCPLFAWEGKVFDVNGKKVTIASSQTSGVRAGTRLYVLKEGTEVGQGRVGNVFHTKVEMTLTGGVAEKGLVVTDKSAEKKQPDNVSSAKYLDNQNGTVSDKKNKIVWKKCSHGQSDDANCSGVTKSVVYCEEGDTSCYEDTVQGLRQKGPLYAACEQLNTGTGFAARKNWRVPTLQELKTLVYCSNGPASPLPEGSKCNPSKTGASIDLRAFPNTTGDLFWSSSPDIGSPYVNGGTISFADGSIKGFYKSYTNSVRCVASE